MIRGFKKATTLLELLIVIALFFILILAFLEIDLFSRRYVMMSDRMAKAQNEVFYGLEHISKELIKAIGDINNVPVTISTIGSDTAMIVWTDYTADGQFNSTNDRQIAYRHFASEYRLRYYSNYTDWTSANETLSAKITNFTPTYSSANNYVNVNLTACYDADGNPYACGNQYNPDVRMPARIKMPSVSAN